MPSTVEKRIKSLLNEHKKNYGIYPHEIVLSEQEIKELFPSYKEFYPCITFEGINIRVAHRRGH